MNPGTVIKQKRRELGMTLEEVSRRTEFSVGYLSKLERADSVPPLATLQKLAEVLGLDMIALLSIGQAPSETGDQDIEICRAPVFAAGEHASQPLLRDFKNRAIVPFLMRILPGQTETYTHDAEEFLYVVEGEITLCYKENRYLLKRGDGAYLDSRRAHRFENNGNTPALVLTANYIYRRF